MPDNTPGLPKLHVYYRCRKCGTVEGPHQILPADDEPPRSDCGCYTGPRWVRGVWMESPK